MSQPIIEEFEHDVCPACGAESLPAEGVLDQSFRVCSAPFCEKEFWEDLTRPVKISKFFSLIGEIVQRNRS